MNTQFSNQQIWDFSFPDYQSVEFQRISPAYIRVIYFNLLVFLLLIIGGIMGLWYWLYETDTPLFWGNTVLLCVLFSWIALSYILSFKTRRFAVRERDIIYQKGYFRNVTKIIPFNRIQHSEISEGWLSRSLKLQTIALYTAGGDEASIKIAGLPKEVAQQLSQLILNKTQEETVEPSEVKNG